MTAGRRARVAILLAVGVASCAGSYYVPAKPRLVAASGMDAVTVFHRVLERSRELGMLPLESDPARGAFMVFAMIETVQDTPRFSMFKIEIHKDGVVEVTATGYHVDLKTGTMHWRLAERLDWYVSELAQVTRISQPAAGARDAETL